MQPASVEGKELSAQAAQLAWRGGDERASVWIVAVDIGPGDDNAGDVKRAHHIRETSHHAGHVLPLEAEWVVEHAGIRRPGFANAQRRGGAEAPDRKGTPCNVN